VSRACPERTPGATTTCLALPCSSSPCATSLRTAALAYTRKNNISASEHLDGIDRGPGPTANPQGGGDEQEFPATVRLAFPGEILELEVIEQVDAHGVDRQNVHGKANSFSRARARVAVAVRPESGAQSVREERSRRRVQTGFHAAGVPRLEVGQPPRMTSTDEQDVAGCHRHPLFALSRLEVITEDVLAWLEPGDAAYARHVE